MLEESIHRTLSERQVQEGGGVEWFKLTIYELECLIELLSNEDQAEFEEDNDVFASATGAVNEADKLYSTQENTATGIECILGNMTINSNNLPALQTPIKYHTAMKMYRSEHELVNRAALRQRKDLKKNRHNYGYRKFALGLDINVIASIDPDSDPGSDSEAESSNQTDNSNSQTV